MKDDEKARELIELVDDLADLWQEILAVYEQINDEDDDFANVFATKYPFSRSFEEYIWSIYEWKQAIKDGTAKERITYEQTYAKDTDITFIMKYTYRNRDIKEAECVGWYSGEPDVDPNYYKSYIGRNKAVYE